MNEKIKNFMAEAGISIEYVTNTKQIVLLEKFAELIIQECVSCVGSQADKAYLKKHFGLPVESNIVYPATEESWSVESQYKRKYNLASDSERAEQ